jgi:alpha-galactosidase
MLLKVGSKGKPLRTPKGVPLEKYSVTQGGKTYLSDLYYIWRSGSAPKYDRSFEGKPIVIDGTTFDRGFGCKATSKIMFKLNGSADRFKAVVGLDPSYQGEEAVSFKLRNEDPIGPDSILYDSGKMARGTPSKVVDIDVRGVDCLILSIEGKQAPGNWANAHVITPQ